MKNTSILQILCPAGAKLIAPAIVPRCNILHILQCKRGLLVRSAGFYHQLRASGSPTHPPAGKQSILPAHGIAAIKTLANEKKLRKLENAIAMIGHVGQH